MKPQEKECYDMANFTYYVTMLELDGHEICRGDFHGFEQICETMYLHRGAQTLGRIFADNEKVTIYADNGSVQVLDRKDFEVLYKKNGDLEYCKKYKKQE